MGRPPIDSELAAALDLSLKKYRQLEFATHAGKVVSVDAATSEGANRLTIPSVSMEAHLLHVRIDDAARSLPGLERAVIEATTIRAAIQKAREAQGGHRIGHSAENEPSADLREIPIIN